MMRSQRAAHGVEVNRDAGSHDDRLSMKISQTAGRPVDDENADKDDHGGYHAALWAVIAARHPGRAHRIALNDW